MRMYLLACDEDTLTGMRLAGIEGEAVNSREEFISKAQAVIEDETVGVLLVAATVAKKYPAEVIELKRGSKALVTQIPDMLEPTAGADFITNYVRQTVGIWLE